MIITNSFTVIILYYSTRVTNQYTDYYITKLYINIFTRYSSSNPDYKSKLDRQKHRQYLGSYSYSRSSPIDTYQQIGNYCIMILYSSKSICIVIIWRLQETGIDLIQYSSSSSYLQQQCTDLSNSIIIVGQCFRQQYSLIEMIIAVGEDCLNIIEVLGYRVSYKLIRNEGDRKRK